VIVDLTEICSPNPSHSNDARKQEAKQDVQRGDGIMESNRSRRRRRQERKSNEVSGREEEIISANRTSSNSSSGDTLLRMPVQAYGRKSDVACAGSKKNTSNASARSATSQSSKNSNKNSPSGERYESDNSRFKRRRKGEDENDVIIDPAPRKKLPLNIYAEQNHEEKSSSDPRERRESKLKRRKIYKKLNSQDTIDNTTTRSVAPSNSNKQRPDNQRQFREAANSRENDNKKKSAVHSDDSKRWKNSSTKDNKTGKGNRNQTGPSLAKYFIQRERPRESQEDLLERANSILRKTFKHNSLRPLQDTAVKGALKKTSQIVIMATGGGKSICYQLPALAGGNTNINERADNSSVTIVVCPLIALMIDQVENLHRKGVHTAASLSSTNTAKEKQEIFHRLQTETKRNQSDAKPAPIQLLYCTPELIQTDKFRSILTKLYESNRLYMFAIDEAHCLSTWGHDFRPAFTKLTWVRDAFPEVPVMACTGTATAKVVQDIRSILQFDKNVPCIMGTFNRLNISYEVRFKDSLDAMKPEGAMGDLVAFVKAQHNVVKKKNEPCSGIVYVHKREDCSSLAAKIGKATGLVCLAYHAGLKDALRSETQQKWTNGTCDIAVATVAFGMGIDLPHVRYVIHWTMAKSLEGFYQESGRGGRDGKPALSLLYYSKDDASKFAYLAKLNAERAAKKKGKQNGFTSQKVDHSILELEGMVNYCTKPMCKRKYVLQHFGEQIDASVVCKKTCDYCISPAKVEREIQASECMSTVVNSHRLMHAGRVEQNKGKKFHHNPLADEDSFDGYGSDDFLGSDEGLLGFDYAAESKTKSDPKKGFVKASSVLNKYEAKELGQGKKGGFVNFKTRTFDEPTQEDIDAKRHRAINIPEHLRSSMPDPLAKHKKAAGSAAAVLKKSSSYASDADRLKAELAQLEKQKQAALAKMGGSLKVLSSRVPSSSLPTPSLSFRRRR